MFDATVFAANLRTARKQRQLSQTELAQRLFVSTQAVSKWERSEAVPDIDHICRLSQLFGMSTDRLLGVQPTANPALIAVDGGGTKTEFVLITPTGQVKRRLVLPGANPNGAGLDGSVAILRQGIDALLQEGYGVQAVFIGCAGMASGGHGAAAEDALRKVYPRLQVQCRSDILNILSMAADPDNAIAVICGTGSVVYATCDGQLRRFGGSGWRLETVGSGYDLGRSALLAALEHRDGTGMETALTGAIEQRLGSTVWDAVGKLHSENTAFFADLAPLVLSAWQSGDPVATAIAEATVARLAQLVNTAAAHAPNAKQVLLGGSLLTKSEALRSALCAQLAPTLCAQSICVPPIWGACLRSAALAKLPAPNLTVFTHSYKED